MVHLRDWRSDDLDWWVALRSSWYPEMGSEEYIRSTSTDPSVPWILRRVAADEDGRRLGAIVVREGPGGMDIPLSIVVVEPSARGLGVGTRLWREACRTIPGSGLYMSLPDRDIKSLAVLEHWGFEVVQHGIEMAMDLSRADRNPSVMRDISVTVIHDSELDASGIDVDSVLLEGDSPEARELGWVMSKADMRAQGDDLWWVVARQGEQTVAVTVAADEGDVWQLMVTEVLASHRRRGVARLVKTHLHAAAVGAGARQVSTQSEEGNTAVLHLNETLGYQVIGGEYRLVHPGLPFPGDDVVPEVTRPVP